MNDPRRTRLLIGLVVALALLNLGLLTWLWLRPTRSFSGRNRLSNTTFLADTLGFNTRQRQQLTGLQNRYFAQVQPRQQQLRKARRAYFRLTNDTFSVDQRRSQRLVFYQQSAELDSLTLAHFDRVAALCTPAQRQLLDKLLSERAYRSFRRPGRSRN